MDSIECVTFNNGLKMPIVGFGTSAAHLERVTYEVMRKSLKTALEVGYRSIDTAYLYRNEDAIGDELQEWFSTGKLKREDVFITSKLPAVANRASDVSRFLSMSLKKLKLDYLDLYLIHFPVGLKCLDVNNLFATDSNDVIQFDFDTDHESIWREMEREVEAGRTKSIGLSNFNISQTERILNFAKIAPVANQVELHAYLQLEPLVKRSKELGVVIVAYSPIGAPHTKEWETITPKLLENPTPLKLAKKYNKSITQVLLRYTVQRGIVVIPKSITTERIESNFKILDFSLTEDEMKEMAKLDRGEDGRIYHFREVFPGCMDHKEYPFPKRS